MSHRDPAMPSAVTSEKLTADGANRQTSSSPFAPSLPVFRVMLNATGALLASRAHQDCERNSSGQATRQDHPSAREIAELATEIPKHPIQHGTVRESRARLGRDAIACLTRAPCLREGSTRTASASSQGSTNHPHTKGACKGTPGVAADTWQDLPCALRGAALSSDIEIPPFTGCSWCPRTADAKMPQACDLGLRMVAPRPGRIQALGDNAQHPRRAPPDFGLRASQQALNYLARPD